eukprot:353568-Chlamydomonas_euryale.AAC.7
MRSSGGCKDMGSHGHPFCGVTHLSGACLLCDATFQQTPPDVEVPTAFDTGTLKFDPFPSPLTLAGW